MLSTASLFHVGQFVFKVIFSFTVSCVCSILLQSCLTNGKKKKAPGYHVCWPVNFSWTWVLGHMNSYYRGSSMEERLGNTAVRDGSRK